MSVRPIRENPDPVLRKKARRVSAIDRDTLRLVADMTETLLEARGLGLAAPQVGASVRVAVFHMQDKEPFALINPEIVKRIGEREVTEGCLSIPGYQGKIKRSQAVTVKGLDCAGQPVRLKAKEILAQCLEHEIDHLNGILFIDHLESPDKLYKIEPHSEEDDASETDDAL
jgi:peptide deformylase